MWHNLPFRHFDIWVCDKWQHWIFDISRFRQARLWLLVETLSELTVILGDKQLNVERQILVIRYMVLTVYLFDSATVTAILAWPNPFDKRRCDPWHATNFDQTSRRVTRDCRIEWNTTVYSNIAAFASVAAFAFASHYTPLQAFFTKVFGGSHRFHTGLCIGSSDKYKIL